MKMADAKQKRNEQLKRWIGSETDLEPPVVKRQKTKVKFDDGAVFLAACSSGDTDEVLKLLHRGADINYANVDGLTALHQVCAPRRRPSDPAGPALGGRGLRSAPLGASGSPERLPAEEGGGRERAVEGRGAGGPFRPAGGGVGNRPISGAEGRGAAVGPARGQVWTCVWAGGRDRDGCVECGAARGPMSAVHLEDARC